MIIKQIFWCRLRTDLSDQRKVSLFLCEGDKLVWLIIIIKGKEDRNMEQILRYYRQTSCYTDLGYYKEFAERLPDSVDALCILQRMQIIHPVVFLNDPDIRRKQDTFWGDMTKVPTTKLMFEDELFPTAISMLSELLRRNTDYSVHREAKDKLHVTCRGQAILLAAVLKAKGYPARARSGFAPYIKYYGICYDHWITEYYKEEEARWVLVDADLHCPDHEIDFNLNDMPRNRFLFGAEAYLGLRRGAYTEDQILYASNPPTIGLKAAIRGLLFDFHCLMNDEILFYHVPVYIQDQDFTLSEEEYQELDELAELMLEPDGNFESLCGIWKTREKFRMMTGAMN